MSADDDLRSALRTEAGRYDPADDGWTGITAGVRSARRRRRLQGGALGGVASACVAVGIALAVSGGGGGSDVDAGRDPRPVATAPEEPAPSTPAPGPTPTSSTTTSTTAVAPPVTEAVFPGIWPYASTEALADPTYDLFFDVTDPAVVAEAFARDYVGMLDPVVGEPEPVGEGAVDVVLRQRGEDGQPLPATSVTTVVSLRSFATPLGGSAWTVVGAASPSVVVDEPAPGGGVSSPLIVRGEATGYEGTVVAEVREDGMAAGESLGQEVGIAGTLGELGPLEVDVAFRAPTAGSGALVLTTDSGRDGVGAWAATVVRLDFTDPGEQPDVGEPGSDCRVADPEGEPSPDEMDVTVHFVCDAAVAAGDPIDAATFVPVVRRLPRDAGVLGATLRTFLAGTSGEGDEAGLSSATTDATTAVEVTISSGTAVVDFDESLTSAANGASTSTGSLLFRGALDRTVLQFTSVERVEYRLGGSCDAFWQWQQVGDCRLVTRDDL